MANEKYMNSRIQHKHDIEANWLKATTFIPKQGELIIYDIDGNFGYKELKQVMELPMFQLYLLLLMENF